jgi:hypothetical protein
LATEKLMLAGIALTTWVRAVEELEEKVESPA